ncbi:MAG: YcaQ family DNA glycosylase [Dehalococcoidales bacterium]|nr:MAG: YcaQ family DNA glycosylase [Dehalococcoidales bacterium]
MDSVTLTKQQARRFILAHQGLWPPYRIKGKSGILDFIRHVGCIQFDPLDIVGHNPELVLQSRVSDFRPTMLQELLYEDRKLLDGLDKQMAIYCIEDWPYFVYRQREATRRSRRRSTDPVKAVSPQILKAIEESGPLSSIDLDHDQKVDWSWGPTRLAKVALDNMYYLGELVIHSKVHTRKVYDLASRHVPEELLSAHDPHKTEEEYHDWHVLRRIGSVGLLWNRGGMAWSGIYGVGTIYWAGSKERAAALKRLCAQGKAVEVHVENIKTPLHMRNQDTIELDTVMEPNDRLPHAAIIAPLDNLLWERDLIGQLFGFDYTWEVYKPVAERRYGYYVLPVLYGDRFVARFEPGRDKGNGALIIKNWWWEPDITQSEKMRNSLQDCFKRFMDYLGTDNLRIDSELVQKEGLDWLPFAIGRH